MSEERRRYFRIDDTVYLHFQLLPTKEQQQRIDAFWQDESHSSPGNEFTFQLEQHQADLNHIKARIPELGRYLMVLEEQIQLLTEKVYSKKLQNSAVEMPVSLSGQGIAFESEIKVSTEERMEINIKLLPEGQHITLIGRVISCSALKTPPDMFKLSVDFEHIREADREVIVKHVHNKQLIALSNSQYDQD